MKSRWEQIRPQAVRLRKQGYSIKAVEQKLGIPRSTLSGWFKDVSLTKKQKDILEARWKAGLVNARRYAKAWHNLQKENRLTKAKDVAQNVLTRIKIPDEAILELALAFLYLGEGSKKNSSTALGSSDPFIARFFVQSVQRLYHIPRRKIRCHLHLRADQNEITLKRYWSRTLNLPSSCFGKTSIDKRTLGRSTYPDYMGVCAMSCGRVEIQRRLVYIARGFCEKIAQMPS